MVMPGFGSVGDPRAEVGSNDDVNAANTSARRNPYDRSAVAGRLASRACNLSSLRARLPALMRARDRATIERWMADACPAAS